ncbi:DMT family transporter [Bacteroidota bacterium]
MFESRIGELSALLTAIFWTVTALSFESAGKRVGSLAVNFIRLSFAMVFLILYSLVFRGIPFPSDADSVTWFWLSISGFVGLVLGDLFLFRAFIVIGSRVSMLIMSLVPPVTALIGWIILGEVMSLFNFLGMGLTISGIALVILGRDSGNKQVKFNHPVKGILYAFGGVLGQAAGLVLSKYGMGSYNAFAATQIRVIASIFGFGVILFAFKRWPRIRSAVRNRKAMTRITVGSFFGPFLGVSFSLLAVQYIATGAASTIMSIVPVLIIPPAVILLKEKVTFKEVIGAVIAVTGVVLFFL